MRVSVRFLGSKFGHRKFDTHARLSVRGWRTGCLLAAPDRAQLTDRGQHVRLIAWHFTQSQPDSPVTRAAGRALARPGQVSWDAIAGQSISRFISVRAKQMLAAVQSVGGNSLESESERRVLVA